MKPISLSMSAYGPFAGQESLDFIRLGESPLFLINGPAGAGKTTLLAEGWDMMNSYVVQSYSGGIKLDTLFVDEGFGSPDPESLDLAIDTLIDLQQGGRMVGVISHVPELKERIDVWVDVVVGKVGSGLNIQV